MGKPAEGASLEIGQKFQDLVATLEHAQVEFDLGCEHIFQTNGSVRDGKFVGLALDETNEDDRTAERIAAWGETLKKEGL